MRVVCVVLICSLGGALDPVVAQERAWFLSGNSLTKVALNSGGREWIPERRFILPRSSSPTSKLTFTNGGRYIVVALSRDAFGQQGLVRLDTRSGESLFVPLPTPVAQLAVDRRSGHLVILDASGLSLVDVGGLRVLAYFSLPAEDGEYRALAVARGRAFVGRQTPTRAETVVIDLTSGEHLSVMPDVWYPVASRDEAHVYLQRAFSSPLTPLGHAGDAGVSYIPGVDVEAWDTRSLAFISSTSDNTVRSFFHVTGRVLVSENVDYPIRIRAYEPSSLDVIFETGVWQGRSLYDVLELEQPSARAPIVLRYQWCDHYFPVCGNILRVYDPSTFELVRFLMNPTFIAPFSTMLMFAPPDQPANVQAVVVGRSVTLEWNPPPDVGEYEIDAGSAPGARDIGTFATGGAAFARFDGVPPGTYYVRVRAINELGATESAELRVVVP